MPFFPQAQHVNIYGGSFTDIQAGMANQQVDRGNDLQSSTPKQTERKGNGLRLLALDGGGIRGISELVILGEIMNRIKHEEQLKDVPRPCQYFDLIGGTSTGGLIALMLGRLGMSVEDAKLAYTAFAEQVFSKKKIFWQDGTFQASALEAAIKEIVFKHGGDRDARMRNDLPSTSCKTFVCAMPAHNMQRPRIFRSYDVPENQTYNCKIWEAARATTAAPTFFKRMYIGEEGMKEEFVDAGLGCNNPVAQVLAEAKAVFGEERKVVCIVNIGTGHPRTIGFRKPDAFQRMLLPTNLISVLQQIATDCENVSEEFETQFNDTKPKLYFRFNVQQGLQDVSLAEWEKLAEVVTHTSQYLGETLVGVNINEVRDILRQNTDPMSSLQELPDAFNFDTEVLHGQLRARLEEIRARLMTAFKDVGEYKRLLSCQGVEAQSLLDAFQLILRTSRSENYIRADFIVATRRLSSKTNCYPAPFYLADVHLLTQQPIAGGGYADIHKGEFQGKDVCIKIIKVYQTSIDKHIVKVIAREAIIWGQLSHPNLLPFYGLYRVGKQLSLISPWADNGTVLEFLTMKPTADRILLCLDIAGGIAYLHDNNIVHGDLKGANVLVDRSCRAYLADFGLSAVEDAEILHWTSQSASGSTGGTVRWRAPELFEPESESSGYNGSTNGSSGPSNTKATDVYAWSCTDYEIFTMRLPFSECRHDYQVISKVAAGARPTRPVAGEEQRGLTDHIWKLLNDCWERNPDQRPSITEVLSRLAAVQEDDCRPPGEWKSGLAAQNEGLGDSVISLTIEDLNVILSREPQE